MLMIRSAGLFDGDQFLAGPATVVVEGGTIAGVEPGWPDPPEQAEVLVIAKRSARTVEVTPFVS